MKLVVLIVDDEPLIAEETSIGLELEGYETLIAESASEAFAILAFRSDVGVLVSDVRMPSIDGVALAKRTLAGRADHDALSVILMTGHAEDRPPLGVTACISKPFPMSAIVGLVAEAMTAVAAKRIAAGMQREEPLLLF